MPTRPHPPPWHPASCNTLPHHTPPHPTPPHPTPPHHHHHHTTPHHPTSHSYVDVDTTACGFKDKQRYPDPPRYFTALLGRRLQWRTRGVHVVGAVRTP